MTDDSMTTATTMTQELTNFMFDCLGRIDLQASVAARITSFEIGDSEEWDDFIRQCHLVIRDHDSLQQSLGYALAAALIEKIKDMAQGDEALEDELSAVVDDFY